MLGWFKRRRANPAALLRRALGEYELPSFPVVVTTAARKLRDPNVRLSDVGAELKGDPGVTAKALAVANSSAYGLGREVRCVSHAVALMGRSRTESLLLTVAVRRGLPADRAFWQTAARRASISRAFARLLHPATEAESFTISFLQDMAVPVLRQVQPDAYATLLEAEPGVEAGSSVGFVSRERELLGWDHAEVAGSMCAQWAFPEALTDAIAAHHDLEAGEVVPHAVRLASLVMEPTGEPASDGDAFSDVAIAQCAEQAGVDPQRISELLKGALEDASALSEVLA